MGDSPIPGPADLVGLVIGVGGTLVAGGVLGWSAVTTTTAVQDHVIEGTETSKKEDPPERRPYCMAAALGDKPPMPIGPTLTINEAEAMIIASITAEGAKGIMRPHKSLNVDNARIHVGAFSETRDDVVALQKRFASKLIENIAEKGKIIITHLHIARQGNYKKIHIWHMPF